MRERHRLLEVHKVIGIRVLEVHSVLRVHNVLKHKVLDGRWIGRDGARRSRFRSVSRQVWTQDRLRLSHSI
jgi:hypothetical protein